MSNADNFFKWLRAEAEGRSPARPSNQGGRIPSSLRGGESQQAPAKKHLVIICAVGPEYAAVEAVFSPDPGQPRKGWSPEFRDNVVYQTATTPTGISIAIAQQDQMGMTAAAILATKAIRDYSPECIAMTGICGGVEGHSSLGDVVVAEIVFDYGSGKFSGGKLIPDFRQIPIDPKLRALWLDYCKNGVALEGFLKQWPDQVNRPKSAIRTMPGIIASGAAVVADPEVVASVRAHQRKVHAIEMEAYGVAHAAVSSGTAWIVVKSVCDMGDDTKSDNIQNFCAHASARVLRDFVELNRQTLFRTSTPVT